MAAATSTSTSFRTYTTTDSAASTWGRFKAHDPALDLSYEAPYRTPITGALYRELKLKADLYFDQELVSQIKKQIDEATGLPKDCFMHSGQVGTYQGFRFMGVDLATKPDATRWTVIWPRNHGKNLLRATFEDIITRNRREMLDHLLMGTPLPGPWPNGIRYGGRRSYGPNDTVLTSTEIKTKPRSTVMDRSQLLDALAADLHRAAQVEKELGDARRTIEKRDRTIECLNNRLVNSDAQLEQQMGDNDRQRRTIYDLEAQIKALRQDRDGLKERCNTQLISLGQQEQQIKNQAATIESQRQTIGRLDARVRTQGDMIRQLTDATAATLQAIKTQASRHGMVVDAWARADGGWHASVTQAPVEPSHLGEFRPTGLEPLVQVAKATESRQAYNVPPIGDRFKARVGSWLMVDTTDAERREFLRQAQAAGKRIQVWHLNLYRGQRMNEVNSGNGQWDDIRGKTDFQCPAHLYRVHPEDL